MFTQLYLIGLTLEARKFLLCSLSLNPLREFAVRQPSTIERLFLDFDGFFASVEQQARPALRGKAIGVVPFEGAVNTCVIACSKEAKKLGVKNVMPVLEAKSLCPELILVPQSPDLYRRAHNALLSEISSVIPIDAVKSIDELTCVLSRKDRHHPQDLSAKIKNRLRENIGPYITCSIGMAANRLLAKIACKMDKPDGLTVWNPRDLPGPLLNLPFSNIPGVGSRMELRLLRAGISDMPTLLQVQPKQMRGLWGNITGERLWYGLHGYDVQAARGARRMFGHGRVLPPNYRTLDHARTFSRLMLVKAARRLRRSLFYAGRLWLWLSLKGSSWRGDLPLPIVRDDQAILAGLEKLWERARAELPRSVRVFRIGVTLLELSSAKERQLDLFLNDDVTRRKWEALTDAIDRLNAKYGKTTIAQGPWVPPPGGNAGGKISYTRIPRAEDFW